MNQVNSMKRGRRRTLKKSHEGFTLIELLVVIAIIALLAAIVLVAVSTGIKRAHGAQRVSDLRQIATALELYKDDHGAYPSTGFSWLSQCAGGGNLPADQVVPGLVPKYMSKFPTDPTMDAANSRGCYYYRSDSNGTDYVLLDYDIAEYSPSDYKVYPSFLGTGQDGGTDPCIFDGTAYFSWKIGTPGAQCW